MSRCVRSVFTAIAVVLTLPLASWAQPPGMGAGQDIPAGLTINQPGALPGYTLIFPMNSTSTYLIDNEGRIVNEWKSEYTPALSAYLLPDGSLFRPGAERGGMNGGPGTGGRLQRFNWEGELLWDFSIESLKQENARPHHDACPLPNGNVLVIISENKPSEEAIAQGRRPESVQRQMQADSIWEIKPTGKDSGEVVWEWHAWDHLVQDVDSAKPNYGDVSEHPELIDVNFGSDRFSRALQDPQQLAQLRSLGYVGGGTPRPGDAAPGDTPPADGDAPPPADRPDGGPGRDRGGPGRGPGGDGDWMHTNSVAYNEALDQIMLSIHGFSEVWIIDHSTSTAEAASHKGGKSGKGGDLLYRWGNPQAYRTGSNVDQRLFQQHCAHWIPKGLPGEGHMLVFNNGSGRPDGTYSSVDEVILPVHNNGSYEREEYVAFGPENATWSYTAEDKPTFHSGFISGAQRLPNGNTLICSGNTSIVFEVTTDMKTVWRYRHPGGGFGGGGGGGFPGFTLPRPGEILPEFLQGALQFTDEQKASLTLLQKHVDTELEKILTDDQRKQLDEMSNTARNFGFPGFAGPGPGGPGNFGPGGPGNFGPGGPGNFGPGGPGGDQANRDRGPRGGRGGRDRGPGDRGPGGRGGPGGGGPGGLFRSYRYAADYAAFAGRTLKAGEKLEVVAQATNAPAQGPPGDRPGRPQ